MDDSAFYKLTGRYPYDHQREIAIWLEQKRNILLCAPTGSGKTLAVLAPFLLNRRQIGVHRLIYTLPMRTLAQGIHAEAKALAAKVGCSVTIQTGEQPEDPFFDEGDIVVTTYDQLLSGYLCGPYGQSSRLYNMNAAAVAGCLVVFDEFHLMEPDKAFLTGIECIKSFSNWCLSVWMTATATSPLCERIKKELKAETVSLTSEQNQAAFGSRQRIVCRIDRTLSASDIKSKQGRVLVVVNQVKRAQQLFDELGDDKAILLHSRFFASDRESKRQKLYELFGKKSKGPAAAIATQVVEAGLDLSCDYLLTELCPMNALAQRAGRCARFEDESGVVEVYKTSSPLPYVQGVLDNTWACIPEGANLHPSTVEDLVEKAHKTTDERLLIKAQNGGHASECRKAIVGGVARTRNGGISHLIRESSDTVRVIVSDSPEKVRPSEREQVQLWRTQLKGLQTGWIYDPEQDALWRTIQNAKDIEQAYVVCLPRSVANYTRECGLQLGSAGQIESGVVQRLKAKEFKPYRRELLSDHLDNVKDKVDERINQEISEGSLLSHSKEILMRCGTIAARYHDLGKDQEKWQAWAKRYQTLVGEPYPEALAHTDYDPNNLEHRRAAREADKAGGRPPHAAASAFYFQQTAPEAKELPVEECFTVIAAIVSHHGGWSGSEKYDGGIGRLTGKLENSKPNPVQLVHFTQFLNDIICELRHNWPLISYIMRVLRLADQLATEEANDDQ